MDGVGGWWEDGGGLASPALCKRVVCMACPSFSAPPRRLKSRSRCQGGYTQLEVGKPGTSPAAIRLARGAKDWETNDNTWCQLWLSSVGCKEAGSGMLMLI